MESLTSSLSDEHCDYLLSLSNAEFREWLGTLPVPVRQAVRQQLSVYQTPGERCEQSLYEFVRQAWHIVEPDRSFIDGWHIRAICQHLEAVDEGKIRDLLINVPPGHCKSRICNVFFPAWVWMRKPSARFLHASYAQELATRDSVDCRYIIESDWYRARWGHIVRLTDDQNQKIKFSTSQHGWRMATSVDGRGTGEHPDFIMVDDPHNVKQPESEVERQSCLRWWDSTIASRGLIRGVRRVVIMQRDFILPGGFGEMLGNQVARLRPAIEPTRRVLDTFRSKHLTVLHTREGHRPDLSDCPPSKRARGKLKTGIGDQGPMGRVLIRGERGHGIIEPLAPLPSETVIDKPGKRAFYATDLELILRNLGILALAFHPN